MFSLAGIGKGGQERRQEGENADQAEVFTVDQMSLAPSCIYRPRNTQVQFNRIPNFECPTNTSKTPEAAHSLNTRVRWCKCWGYREEQNTVSVSLFSKCS